MSCPRSGRRRGRGGSLSQHARPLVHRGPDGHAAAERPHRDRARRAARGADRRERGPGQRQHRRARYVNRSVESMSPINSFSLREGELKLLTGRCSAWDLLIWSRIAHQYKISA